MSRIKSRLARLERRINKDKTLPYLSFPDEAAFEAWKQDPKGIYAYKIYIGWSPDDWDNEDESND